MSSVQMSGLIGYGHTTSAVFYTDDSRVISQPKDTGTIISSSSPWALWGDNNDDPAVTAADIEGCAALNGGTQGSSRIATGLAPEPYLLVNKDKDGNEELEWVDDPDIHDFLELNESFKYSFRNIYNMVAYGWGATQFILNKGRDKINRIHATDVYTARLEKKNNAGLIANMYLCADWSQQSSYDPQKMKRIEVLREGYELQDLDESVTGGEFAMLHRMIVNGTQYYPKANHRSAKDWVTISRSIPNIKKAMNVNQMSIKYVIIIAENYWTRTFEDFGTKSPEDKQAIIQKTYDDINTWLTGELNAGKTFIAGSYFDANSEQFVDDIKITVLDDKLKDGKMLPDGAAADKQILFSMFFNPAIWGGNLLGDGASGGAGSGSDIREATLVLLAMLNPERQMNLKAFNIVKRFNGWSKRLEKQRDIYSTQTTPTNTAKLSSKKITPRLVFRYNSTILTTLDSGGSTQQTNS